MGRTFSAAAGDNPAPKYVSLTLKPARQKAEHQPEKKTQKAQDDHLVGNFADPGYLLCGDPRKGLQQGRWQREKPGHHQEQAQASKEEEPEKRQMPMRHVAHFMTQYGRHLDGRERLDEGVAQQNITKRRKDAGHASVDHEVPRVPDQKVIEPKAGTTGDSFQTLAQGP